MDLVGLDSPSHHSCVPLAHGWQLADGLLRSIWTNVHFVHSTWKAWHEFPDWAKNIETELLLQPTLHVMVRIEGSNFLPPKRRKQHCRKKNKHLPFPFQLTPTRDQHASCKQHFPPLTTGQTDLEGNDATVCCKERKNKTKQSNNTLLMNYTPLVSEATIENSLGTVVLFFCSIHKHNTLLKLNDTSIFFLCQVVGPGPISADQSWVTHQHSTLPYNHVTKVWPFSQHFLTTMWPKSGLDHVTKVWPFSDIQHFLTCDQRVALTMWPKCGLSPAAPNAQH